MKRRVYKVKVGGRKERISKRKWRKRTYKRSIVERIIAGRGKSVKGRVYNVKVGGRKERRSKRKYKVRTNGQM